MATYHAIGAVSQAFITLLNNACPRDEFPDARFEIFQPENFEEGMPEGISLYLYRLTLNTTPGNQPPRRDPGGTRHRPALPIDLHYMLTPWASSALKQQYLLGWAMRLLEDTPVLVPSLLNQGFGDPAPFRPDETVELVYEPLSLQDMPNIWGPFKSKMQLSVTYLARIITIESGPPLVERAPAPVR